MAYITSLEMSSPWDGHIEGYAEVRFNDIETLEELQRKMNRMESILTGDPYYSPRKMIIKCQFCGQWGVRECACKYCGGAVE